MKILIIRAVAGDLRALLEKRCFAVYTTTQDWITGRLDLNSKNQKDFVNIIDYLLIIRRNKQNIDF